MTARSTIIKCATSSAADQLPSPGFVFQSFAGTSSAARRSAPWDLVILVIRESTPGFMVKSRSRRLDGSAASLLESVRELKHTGFTERWSEDLQSYRQLSADFSTGNGDAWHPSQ